MNDLVSRQGAIDAIKMWGLIDGLSEGEAIEILSDEEKLPSAQSEIIRCKDCKHRYINNDVWTCPFGLMSGPDGYCSWAERKESCTQEQ